MEKIDQVIHTQNKMQVAQSEMQVVQNEMLKTLDKHSKDIAELKGDVKQLKGDVKQLKGDVKQLKGDVKQLKGDVNDLKGSVRSLEINFEKFQDTQDAILEMVTTLVEKSERNDKYHSKIDDTATTAEVTNAALKTHISDKSVHLQ